MYLVFDFIEHEFDVVDTEKEAIKKAGEALQFYKDGASTDGWPEDIVGSVGYAEIKADSRVTKTEKKSDVGEDDWPYDYDEIWYVDLVDKAEVKEEESGTRTRPQQEGLPRMRLPAGERL